MTAPFEEGGNAFPVLLGPVALPLVWFGTQRRIYADVADRCSLATLRLVLDAINRCGEANMSIIKAAERSR